MKMYTMAIALGWLFSMPSLGFAAASDDAFTVSGESDVASPLLDAERAMKERAQAQCGFKAVAVQKTATEFTLYPRAYPTTRMATAQFVCESGSSITQASASTCTPTAGTVRWQEAMINVLHNSSQTLLQVRATGTYLTADLICSLDKCVGFIGGDEARGTLKFDANYNVSGVTFQKKSQSNITPSAEFTCR